MFRAFKDFLIESQIKDEIQNTLKKLPKKHQIMVKGYKFKFFDGCTLKGSKENIGMVHLNNKEKKEIHVAAPWRYGREFTMLHEIAHVIYEKVMKSDKLKKEWKKIVDDTKRKLNQPPEELWCHAYAATYCANPPLIHHHQAWVNFIKKFN